MNQYGLTAVTALHQHFHRLETVAPLPKIDQSMNSSISGAIPKPFSFGNLSISLMSCFCVTAVTEVMQG